MTLEQAMTERDRPRAKRGKVIAPQKEFGFAADAFCMAGEILPPPPVERVQPERAAELFAEMRTSLGNEMANQP